MPVSWQTRFRSSSAIETLRWIVSSTRRPGTDVSRSRATASASRRSCGMSFSAQTYRCAAARPAGDLAARVDAFERGLCVRVDHQTAVLVVQDRVRQDLLAERVDSPG